MSHQKRGYERFRALVESYLRAVFDDPAGTDVVPSMRAFQRATGTSPNTLKGHGLDKEFKRAEDLVSEAATKRPSAKDRRITQLKMRLKETEEERDAALLQVAAILDAVQQHSSLEARQVMEHVIEKPFRGVPGTARNSNSIASISKLRDIYGI